MNKDRKSCNRYIKYLEGFQKKKATNKSDDRSILHTKQPGMLDWLADEDFTFK